MFESVENFLLLNNYKLIELIQENNCKKTKLFKVEKEGIYYIVKSINKASPVYIQIKFFIEVEYY